MRRRDELLAASAPQCRATVYAISHAIARRARARQRQPAEAERDARTSRPEPPHRGTQSARSAQSSPKCSAGSAPPSVCTSRAIRACSSASQSCPRSGKKPAQRSRRAPRSGSLRLARRRISAITGFARPPSTARTQRTCRVAECLPSPSRRRRSITQQLQPIRCRARPSTAQRRLLGAVHSRASTMFRVWAPDARRVEVVFEAPIAVRARTGARPRTAISPAARQTPSRALQVSRRRSGSVAGSLLPLPTAGRARTFADRRSGCLRLDRRRIGAAHDIHGQVFYEMHVGAFTPEGTFDAAAEKLELSARSRRDDDRAHADRANVPGRWNWGYDGVQLYAPIARTATSMRCSRFVDRAHAHRPRCDPRRRLQPSRARTATI